ncbi:MAG: hypothetical protein NTW60_01260 [Candidatus Wolfebacteria bacterium]|nr:hypothetical protein [Candidatus Wolfebacteria bacterium]
MADLENKSVEELVMAVQHSEAAVVTLPEKIITITISVVADILEIIVFLEIATGVLGISIWLMSYIFGFCVSVALFMWSLFRGVNGSFFVKRILIILLGFILDEATA